MQEFLPFALGIIAGGLCYGPGAVRLRGVSALLLTLLGAALCVTINGEWGDAYVALPADAALVTVGTLSALIFRMVLARLKPSAA